MGFLDQHILKTAPASQLQVGLPNNLLSNFVIKFHLAIHESMQSF